MIDEFRTHAREHIDTAWGIWGREHALEMESDLIAVSTEEDALAFIEKHGTQATCVTCADAFGAGSLEGVDAEIEQTRPVVSILKCPEHGSPFGPDGRCATERVLDLVRLERARQYALHGTNDGLADGTGPKSTWLSPSSYVDATLAERRFRLDYEQQERRHGAVTWMHLVREEVAEAFQESDQERLAEELTQVAALCVSWVEKILGRA